MPETPQPSPSEKDTALTVTQLTRAIKRLLEETVGTIAVEGEISNWHMSGAGHAYFALKDDNALLNCVMFRGATARLKFDPGEGDRVLARGTISVYEARGQYQLIVSALEERGEGDLFRKFMELKKKLADEGLFDEDRKRPLPVLPRRIGIVTSPTAAALRDMVHVIRRRFPCVEVVLSPTMVQGAEAPPRIVAAIEKLGRYSAGQPEERRIDVMIVGRGGGSIEDLWCFNDERVARAISRSDIPVVSAVGHETDFTIADFVADLRAPTPSAAAEVVVAEAETLRRNVRTLDRALTRSLLQLTETKRLQLQRLTRSWGLRQPLDLIKQTSQRLDDLSERSARALASRVGDARHRVGGLSGRLDALNPLAVLGRGYSLVTRAKDGKVVTRAKQVRVSDHVKIRLSEGEIRAAVMPEGEDMFDGLSGTE